MKNRFIEYFHKTFLYSSEYPLHPLEWLKSFSKIGLDLKATYGTFPFFAEDLPLLGYDNF